MITFNSLFGDIPLMTYSLTPAGYELYGKDLTFKLVEEVKGQFLPRVKEITGLTPGRQYTAQVYAHNSVGQGESSLSVQNEGMGTIPMSFDMIGEPQAPTITSVIPRSASQLEINVAAPSDNGGAEIDAYIVEYTSDTDFIIPVTYKLRVYNAAKTNDTHGYWRLIYHKTQTTLIPFGASGEEMADAINALPSVSGATVTMTKSADAYFEGYDYDITLNEEVGTQRLGDMTADLSMLTTESLATAAPGGGDVFVFDVYDVTVESVPAEYGSMTMYKECGYQTIGFRTSHQVVTL
jgi:hypothetical protein